MNDNNFNITLILTANRTFYNDVLNYRCDAYFAGTNSLPSNTINRHWSKETPAFLISFNNIMIMDVQCKKMKKQF